jgi:hypothetical protein
MSTTEVPWYMQLCLLVERKCIPFVSTGLRPSVLLHLASLDSLPLLLN